MANIVADFISKFHSIEGDRISERQKQFFILLTENAQIFKSNPVALSSLVSTLEPQTYLESLFRLHLLIYFRRNEELLQILKDGNEIFVSKICKESWFFQQTFNNLPATQIVNEFLPNLSYSTRMKVLKKLSRYSENFDGIFDAVVTRYGLYIALQFITGCSIIKIKQILTEHPIELNSTQLKIIQSKNRDFIEFYCNRGGKYLKSLRNSRNQFLKYLFNTDKDLFYSITEKYKISVKLGRRATKKFVDVKKDEIMQKPYSFRNIDFKTVIRKFGKESVTLFINALPKELNKCLNCDWFFLSFPKRYRYNLFLKIFPSHYQIKYDDYPNLIDQGLLEVVSNRSEQIALAKIKINKGDDDFIKYLSIEESVKLLKEKINLTKDINQRSNLIRFLIETCKINDDLNALVSVMKYYCKRHKNDESSVHLSFIRSIEQYFGYKKFTEEMWKCMNKVMIMLMLKFEPSLSTSETYFLLGIDLGISAHQTWSYLEFLWTKNQSIDDLLKHYFNKHQQFPQYSKYNKNFLKYFLIFAINNIAKNSYELDNVKFCCQLITEISSWNSVHPNDQLSFYDYPILVDIFYRTLKTEDPYSYHFSIIYQTISSKICDIENVHRNEYLEIYWNFFEFKGKVSEIIWFLKFDPRQIVDHPDLVLDKITNYKRALFTVKKFSHLGLDQKFIELSLAKVNDKTYEDVRNGFIPCLSILMTPQDYAKFANNYKPTNRKLDLGKESDVKLFNLQCAIATNFINIKYFNVLSSLLPFCTGDYFKSSLNSLYSLLYRTPENLLSQHLNYLSKEAVSVRKHALFLSCELCSVAEIEKVIIKLNKEEKNLSIQKQLFASTIKYFVKNQNDEFFDLIKLNMKFIDKNDDESLKSIVEYFKKIPIKYQWKFMEFTWEFLERTVEVWDKLKPLKENLLENLNNDELKKISLNFGLKVIQDHFLVKDKRIDYVPKFIFNFLKARDEKDEIFKQVFTILNQSETEDIFSFLRTLYTLTMNLKNVNLSYLYPYAQFYETKISIIENFIDFMHLFFLKTKLESEYSIEQFSEKFLAFFENLIGDYGPYILHLVSSELQSNLFYFLNKETTVYDVYYYMIKQRPIPAVAMLILDIIHNPYDGKELSVFNQIIQEIENIHDMGVQINLFNSFGKFIKSDRSGL